MSDPSPDTPNVCPTCRSTQPAARHTGRWWRLTDGTVDDSRHGPCPDEWHACPAAGSFPPDVTALAKQMGLADDPFFAREYQTNIYVHALMHLAEAQAARITELEAAIRVHRDRFLDGPYFQPDDGALWAVLAESPDG